jgi:hypothetical protein
MPRRRRNLASNIAQPNHLTLQIDPNVVLQVKMVEPDKRAKGPNIPLRILLIVAFAGFIALVVLWTVYIRPVVDPQRQDLGLLSVSLKHPAYVARGDDNELDVTITNRGAEPVSGTVALVFTGNAGARPLSGETTGIELDKLGGGASVTKRVKFDVSQNASRFDNVRLALQMSAANQQAPPRELSQIAIAPVPYLRAITSAAKVFSLSAIITSIVTLVLNEIRKKLFGGESK